MRSIHLPPAHRASRAVLAVVTVGVFLAVGFGLLAGGTVEALVQWGIDLSIRFRNVWSGA